MSFCPHCKSELSEKDADICPACRRPVTATDSFYTSPTVAATSPEAERIARLWRPTLKGTETIISTVKGREPSATKYPSVVVKARALKKPDREHPPHVQPDYELLKILGEGGIGVVYAARQTSVDRVIALKMLRPESAGDERVRSGFMIEATVTADLDHPNIVPVHELGSDEHGDLYYAMKRVVGTPWRKAIRHKTLAENIEILLRVADAVAFAHSRGVVHRDLKPDNVMLGDFGEVLVMDWGLAAAGDTAGRSKAFPLSAESAIGGTPAYMAPEMARGEVEAIGPASDIYLLGAILYEIVTGFPPHHGDDAVTCIVAAGMNRIRVTDKTGELVDIAVRAMSTNPADRYPCVKDFQSAIRAYLSHAESVGLAAGAERLLRQAREAGTYEDYARAAYMYEHAVEMWPDNAAAQDGAREARMAYATCALERGDLDLAASCLGKARLGETDLGRRVEAARRERDAKTRRIKILIYVAVILGLSVLSTYTLGYFRIRAEQSKYVAEMTRAVLSETISGREKEKLKAAHVADRLALESERRHLARVGYANAVALAELCVVGGDRSRARRALADAPAEFRGWEWGWLAARCAEAAPSSEASWAGFRDVTGLSLDRSGGLLLTAQGREVVLWDVAARRERFRMARDSDVGADFVTLLPDGGAMVVPGAASVRVVQLPSGRVLLDVPGDGSGVAALSGDGRRLAVPSEGGAGIVYDLPSSAPVARLRGWVARAGGEPICLGPFGRRALAGVGRERLVRLWDAETGLILHTYPRFESPVLSLAMTPDGDIALAVCADGAGRLFEVEGGREIARVAGVERVLQFTPDGRRFMIARRDGALALSETETGRELLSLPGRLAAFSGDGRRLAVLDREGVLAFLDAAEWSSPAAREDTPRRAPSEPGPDRP